MTFAQALARIEELKSGGGHSSKLIAQAELNILLHDHADSIVQLGKVAAEMREIAEYTPFQLKLNDNYALAQRLEDTAKTYDKLLNGEEG